jgi:AcrR family transcriptional regulator
MARSDDIRDGIIDTALALGERHASWEAVRLHEVAAELNITLDEVRRHFRDKDALADAWLDRADAAMLVQAQAAGFVALFPRERLQRLITAWLEALAPHRKLTRQMIYGRFEAGRLHLQLPGLIRVSRTVQWLREAAQRDTTFQRRVLEESGLAALYLMTFLCWLEDDSRGAERTHRFLERSLKAAEQLDHWLCAGRGRAARRAPTPAAGPAADEPTL